MIWALWNSHVETFLPEIDQNAILEYYEEKRIESLAKQGFFARLWNLIKGWFRGHCDKENLRWSYLSISRLELGEFPIVERSEDQKNPLEVESYYFQLI
uniref:Uncharacterized protein n=1 Tax=Parascaris equorum TaxID=6256 RepID=A0A914RFK5_PAREQ